MRQRISEFVPRVRNLAQLLLCIPPFCALLPLSAALGPSLRGLRFRAFRGATGSFSRPRSAGPRARGHGGRDGCLVRRGPHLACGIPVAELGSSSLRGRAPATALPSAFEGAFRGQLLFVVIGQRALWFAFGQGFAACAPRRRGGGKARRWACEERGRGGGISNQEGQEEAINMMMTRRGRGVRAGLPC